MKLDYKTSIVSSTIYNVVMKLVGPVMPVGESHTDEERLKNLRLLTDVVDRLLFEVSSVATCSTRHEHSIKKAGKFAVDVLKDIRDAIEDSI